MILFIDANMIFSLRDAKYIQCHAVQYSMSDQLVKDNKSPNEQPVAFQDYKAAK